MPVTIRLFRVAVGRRLLLLLLLAVIAVFSTSSSTNIVFAHAAAAALCDTPESYRVPDGRDYRGTVNITYTGIPCQPWDKDSPQKHDSLVPNPSLGLGFHNYCRNPFGDTTAGCFTMDPTVRYQRCAIGVPCLMSTQPRSVTLSVANSSRLSYGQFLSMTCAPQPCNISYVWVDAVGQPPTSNSATVWKLYQQPFAVFESRPQSAPAYLLLQSMFVDGSRLYRTYQLFVDAPPEPSVVFFPSPADISGTSPVLVSISWKAGTASANLLVNSPLLVIINGVVPAVPYTGPFWIANTSRVLVVAHDVIVGDATYQLNIPPALINVYPDSGNFIGGVRVVVFQPPSNLLSIAVYLNGSTTVTAPLETPMSFVLRTVGVTQVRIRCLLQGGLVQELTRVYEVRQAAQPSCSRPSGTYYTPIDSVCSDPYNRSVTILTSNGTIATDQVSLEFPMSMSLTASYVDDLGVLQNASFWYSLVQTTLPPPQLTPLCGSAVVGSRVRATGLLQLPQVFQNSAAFVVASAAPNCTVTQISQQSSPSSSSSSSSEFWLSAPATALSDPQQNITCSFAFSTQSVTDPFAAVSPIVGCQITFVPLLTSPPSPTTATTFRIAGSGDAVSFATDLTTCLRGDPLTAAASPLVTLTPFGSSFVTVQLQPLFPLSLRANYEAQLQSCLVTMYPQPGAVLCDNLVLCSGTSSFVLARSAEITSSNPLLLSSNNNNNNAGAVSVILRGWNTSAAQSIKLVRVGFPCGDVGLPLQLAQSSSTVDQNSGSSSWSLPVMTALGQFQVCAWIDNARYVVPGALLTVVANNNADLFTFTPSCGGALQSDIVFTVSGASQLSVNGGAWVVAAPSSDSISSSSSNNNALLAPISVVVRNVKQTTIVVRRGNVSQVCIFYPAPAAGRQSFSYDFSSTAVLAAGAAASSAVRLSLQSTSPLLEVPFSVYVVPSSRNSSSSSSSTTSAAVSSCLSAISRNSTTTTTTTSLLSAAAYRNSSDALRLFVDMPIVLPPPSAAAEIPVNGSSSAGSSSDSSAQPLVVCVAVGGIPIPFVATATRLSLSPFSAALVSSQRCPSGLETRDGNSCGCIDSATKVASACPLPAVPSDDGSLFTGVRVMFLIVYVLFIVLIWVIAKTLHGMKVEPQGGQRK